MNTSQDGPGGTDARTGRTRPAVLVDENGKPARIWLDPSLPSYPDLVPLVKLHGGSVATSHDAASIVVLHPKSPEIFDIYCHPDWLPPARRNQQQTEERKWEATVLVTGRWPQLCVAAERLLGHGDDWGGCRKGGPPISYIPPVVVTQLPPQFESETTPVIATTHAPTSENMGESIGTANLLDAMTTPSAGIASPSTSSRFPHRPLAYNQKYTTDDLEEALRNAHPMCLFQGSTPGELSRHIHKSWPNLEADTWRRHYHDWLDAAKRFKPLATEKDYLAYVDIFQQYLPHLRHRASLASIAEKLVQDHPGHEKSSTEWKILLGGWLRTVPPEEASQPTSAPDPPKQATSPCTARPPDPNRTDKLGQTRTERRGDTDERRLLLAEAFKRDYDDCNLRSVDVGIEVAEKLGFLPQTVTVWYQQWRRGKSGRFRGIPKHLMPLSEGVAPTAGSPKRKRSPSLEAGPTKRARSLRDTQTTALTTPPSESASGVPAASRSTPNVSKPKASQIIELSTGREASQKRRLMMAKMFKDDYDITELGTRAVSREVAERTGFKSSTVRSWYGYWINGHKRYKSIPDKLRPTMPRPKGHRAPSPSSSESEWQETPRRRRLMRSEQFTNGEEMSMVEYIRDRLPEATETEDDWEDFADENPFRSAQEYAQHHLLHRARIDGLLAELEDGDEEDRPSTSTSPSVRTPRSSRRVSSTATGSTRTPPTKRGSRGREERFVVDLTLSDDDD